MLNATAIIVSMYMYSKWSLQQSGDNLALREKIMWGLLHKSFFMWQYDLEICKGSIFSKFLLFSVYQKRVCMYELASLLHIFWHLKVF